jgi:hypothetical protein
MAPEKLFTPAEAERTLPLVRRIVADIMATGAQLKALQTRAGSAAERETEARKLTFRLQELMAELEHLGCFFKDWNFEIGLVDFPGVIDGRKVMLCWRCDEDTIRYYHPFGESYAARKPIPEQATAG